MDVVRRGNEGNVNGENDSVDGYGVVGWSKGGVIYPCRGEA